jgi:hypothetical protein
MSSFREELLQILDKPYEEDHAATQSAGVDADFGPIRPPEDVRAELARILESDQSRIGEVYRGLQRGWTAEQIASDLGVGKSNFVWNYRRVCAALLDGDLPTAPTVALQAARRFRSVMKGARLSRAAHDVLERNLAELERRANDESPRVIEVQRAQEQTEVAEAQNDVGIYVYALPHYLRYPFDPLSGRTLMKVGRSDSDIIVRFRNQTRTTALPEEPILLRIYRTDQRMSNQIEASFHRVLEAADHRRSVARTAGREWFVSTRFLDEVARLLGLAAVVVNHADVTDAE